MSALRGFLPLFLLFVTLSSHAEVKKEDSLLEGVISNDPVGTVPETDEVDQLITNRRLRADSGSLSQWSVSTSFNYQGGSLSKPLDAARPNISQGADVLTLQSLSGGVGVKYRMTKRFSLTGGIGLFMTTPFHSSIKTNDPELKRNFDINHQKITINDPVLRGTYVGKFYSFQSVTDVEVSLITNNQLKLEGYRWSYSFAEYLMHQIEGTKFSYGGGFSADFYSFSRRNGDLTDQVLAFYPAMEYEINQTFNFRTVFGAFAYQHIVREDSGTYEKRKAYQSLGLGVTLSRNFFLYPNIQYIPSDIRSDRTTIALSGNVNFF